MIKVHPKFSEKYKLENHEILTKDGYVLSILRVVTKCDNGEKAFETIDEQIIKPAVLIIHGLLASGPHWCLNYPEKTLPGILTEGNYDCWILNLRGTPLSRKHVSLKTSSKKYWDFSHETMGMYDVPATITYILTNTGNQQLFCCGHSMGCSATLTMLSLKPEFASKIAMLALMAPAVYSNNLQNKGFLYSAPILNLMSKSRSLRRSEMYSKPVFTKTESSSCIPCINGRKVKVAVFKKCATFMGAMDNDTIDKERLPLFLANSPTPISSKSLMHGMQCIVAKRFCHFNYGSEENLKRYGDRKPPSIPMNKINVPTIAFYSDGDGQITSDDTIQLTKELQNVIGRYRISDRKFSHVEFIVGNKADRLVYDVILKNFQDFIGNKQKENLLGEK